MAARRLPLPPDNPSAPGNGETFLALLARYRAESVAVEIVANDYLNLAPGTAKRRAGACTLPFPAYRADDSQKSPWLVSLRDLAEWLETKQAEARREWEKSNR